MTYTLGLEWQNIHINCEISVPAQFKIQNNFLFPSAIIHQCLLRVRRYSLCRSHFIVSVMMKLFQGCFPLPNVTQYQLLHLQAMVPSQDSFLSCLAYISALKKERGQATHVWRCSCLFEQKAIYISLSCSTSEDVRRQVTSLC